MILCHHGVEGVHLAYGNRGAVRRMIASDGRYIGLTAMSGNLFRHLRAADGHGQEARGCVCLSVFDVPEANRLPSLYYDSRQRVHRLWTVKDVSSIRQLSHTGHFQR
jgi:hypothetical protein